MAKSIIIIEEELIKGENGKNELKRTLRANILQKEIVVYEDTTTPLEFCNEDTLLNNFEKWVLQLHTEKTSTLEK